MNDEERALIDQLIVLEDKIYEEGVYGGMATSAAIAALRECMETNSVAIMKILRKL
jgi:hypothetical protein